MAKHHFAFVHDLFEDIQASSKNHLYVSLHSHQGTPESDTLMRCLTPNEPALVLGYRAKPEQISAPVIIKVFPRRDAQFSFFENVPVDKLVEALARYAGKLSRDPIIKEAIASTSLEGPVDYIIGLKNQGETYLARCGSIVAEHVGHGVEQMYVQKMQQAYSEALVKTLTKRRNKTAVSSVIGRYKKEFGALTHASDVKSVKEMLGSESFIESRTARVNELESLIDEAKDDVYDILDSLEFADIETLDGPELTQLSDANTSLREQIIDSCTAWFESEALELNEILKRATDNICLEDDLVGEGILRLLENKLASYVSNDAPDSGVKVTKASQVNSRYAKDIFSEENIQNDISAMLKDLNPPLRTIAGKAHVAALKKVTPEGLSGRLDILLNGDLPERFSETVVADIFALAFAQEITPLVLDKKFNVGSDPQFMSDAYSSHDAVETASLRDPLFASARDHIIGEKFNYIVYQTTGAFLGDDSKDRKYALLRLSDAMTAIPPTLEQSIEVVYKLGDSLEHIHQSGANHNGITLNNILLSEDVYETLIFGFNPANVYQQSCFSLPDIKNQDSFSLAVILAAMVDGRMPFHDSSYESIKRDILNKRFEKRVKMVDMTYRKRKIRKLISMIFNDALHDRLPAVSEFQQRLAVASGRKLAKDKKLSRSYYDFYDWINDLREAHELQVSPGGAKRRRESADDKGVAKTR